MLHLLGTGLRGIKSITIEELDILLKSDKIYVENYTSVSPEDLVSSLKDRYGIDVDPITRDDVEGEEKILSLARKMEVCILVVGDPLSATTHNQLRLSALDDGIDVELVENASIVTTAPAKAGFLLYKMAPPVSLPFLSEKFLPKSILLKIKRNLELGFHTLLLLDLKDGKTMYPEEAVRGLMTLEDAYHIGVINEASMICVLSNISQPGERIIFDNVRNLLDYKDETSPTVLIIPSKLDDTEERFVKAFSKTANQFK